MTETTEVTGPPKKKHSLVTALLMMGLGGFLVFNYIFSDMFPSEEEKQARAAAAQAVIDEGQAYLKENASGLQYQIIEEGTGAQPQLQDRVVVNYIGRLVNGQVFDSSYARGEPLNIPVNRVIPGWTEALQMMSVGSKWQLVIPSNLGYGANGAGDLIPPHSTLIFDVELVSIDN
jgi:FKBP-type peptidyl-prolyl cis-trans isomerase FklB